jgi:hypothetical protein
MLTSSQETKIRTSLRNTVQPRRKQRIFWFFLFSFSYFLSRFSTQIFPHITPDYLYLLRFSEVISMLTAMVLFFLTVDILYTEKVIIDRGTFVTGVIVQANMNLYRVGGDDLPAVICFSLDESISWDYDILSRLAHRAFYAKSQFPLGDRPDFLAGFLVGMTLNIEQYISGRRTPFPKSWTEGKKVYMEDIMILRKSLKQQHLQGAPLVCLVVPRGMGVMLVPYDYLADAKLS